LEYYYEIIWNLSFIIKSDVNYYILNDFSSFLYSLNEFLRILFEGFYLNFFDFFFTIKNYINAVIKNLFDNFISNFAKLNMDAFCDTIGNDPSSSGDIADNNTADSKTADNNTADNKTADNKPVDKRSLEERKKDPLDKGEDIVPLDAAEEDEDDEEGNCRLLPHQEWNRHPYKYIVHKIVDTPFNILPVVGSVIAVTFWVIDGIVSYFKGS
jgi:hypothetical protein